MMVTDPHRLRRTGPGDPDVCNVFLMRRIYSSADEVSMINTECRTAGIGCVDCRQRFAANLNTSSQPFRARRAEIARDPDYVWDVLGDGGKRARAIAEETMAAVHQAVGLP